MLAGIAAPLPLFQYAVVNRADTFAYLTFVKEVNGNWTKEEQDILIHIGRLLGIFIDVECRM